MYGEHTYVDLMALVHIECACALHTATAKCTSLFFNFIPWYAALRLIYRHFNALYVLTPATLQSGKAEKRETEAVEKL